MANGKKPRVRLVFYHSKMLTKVVVLMAVVLSMVALISLWSAISCIHNSTQTLYAQALALEQSNEILRQDIDALGSPSGYAKIAQQELGYAWPDTVLFQPGE